MCVCWQEEVADAGSDGGGDSADAEEPES